MGGRGREEGKRGREWRGSETAGEEGREGGKEGVEV